jgi:hypothetical protein
MSEDTLKAKKEKFSATFKANGTTSWNKGIPCRESTKKKLSEFGKTRKEEFIKIKGGNGTGMPVCEALLSMVLPEDFKWNYIVTFKQMPGFPTHYKLDFASEERMIGIEVDGSSHSSIERQLKDLKKQTFLECLGWQILRISNEDVKKMFLILK